jgi:hypothetical protein
MQKIMYFTIEESNADGRHVGTVRAETDQELNEKLTIACNSHFDEECELSLTKRENFVYGRSEIIHMKDIGKLEREVHVQETWLY